MYSLKFISLVYVFLLMHYKIHPSCQVPWIDNKTPKTSCSSTWNIDHRKESESSQSRAYDNQFCRCKFSLPHSTRTIPQRANVWCQVLPKTIATESKSTSTRVERAITPQDIRFTFADSPSSTDWRFIVLIAIQRRSSILVAYIHVYVFIWIKFGGRKERRMQMCWS